MDTKRVLTIFLRQFFLMRRSVSRLFGLFYWSSLELFLWGVITVYLQSIGRSGFNFVTVILGAVILWNLLTRIQHGITISFLEDVWVRNFMNLFASPLSVHEYVAGLILTSAFQTFISVSFMAGLAWLLFAYNIFQLGFMLLPFIAILFIFGWALGLTTTAIILRIGPSSEILAWSIPALLTPLSGVFYPPSALPRVLQPVADILPTTHVFEGMRTVVATGAFDARRLSAASILALAALMLSYWLLLRSYRFVIKRGLFTRFMTE